MSSLSGAMQKFTQFVTCLYFLLPWKSFQSLVKIKVTHLFSLWYQFMHLFFFLRYPVLWFIPKVPPCSKIIKAKKCTSVFFYCFCGLIFFPSCAFRSLIHWVWVSGKKSLVIIKLPQRVLLNVLKDAISFFWFLLRKINSFFFFFF